MNSTVNADSAITITPEPATPSTTRAAMNAPAEGAYAQAAEPAPNRARDVSMTRFRPNRSPSSPAGSIAAASTSRYPDWNHCRSDSVAWSAVASVGTATLRIVPSRPTARTESVSAPSAHHLRLPGPVMRVTSFCY